MTATTSGCRARPRFRNQLTPIPALPNAMNANTPARMARFQVNTRPSGAGAVGVSPPSPNCTSGGGAVWMSAVAMTIGRPMMRMLIAMGKNHSGTPNCEERRSTAWIAA